MMFLEIACNKRVCGIVLWFVSLKSYDLSFGRFALGGIFRFRNTRKTLAAT
jgi:hypothetical protein